MQLQHTSLHIKWGMQRSFLGLFEEKASVSTAGLSDTAHRCKAQFSFSSGSKDTEVL